MLRTSLLSKHADTRLYFCTLCQIRNLFRVALTRLSIPLFLTNQYHSVKCIVDLDYLPVLVAGAQRSLLLLSTPATTILPYANAKQHIVLISSKESLGGWKL